MHLFHYSKVILYPFFSNAEITFLPCSVPPTSHAIWIIASLGSRSLLILSYCTMMILAFALLNTFERCSRLPGISRSVVRNFIFLPLEERPSSIILVINETSILPPESRHTTFLSFTSTLFDNTAASVVAPAGSTTCFVLSIR